MYKHISEWLKQFSSRTPQNRQTGNMNKELRRVLRFSGSTDEAVDWESAEKEYGIIFPEDYKELIEKHGAGSINECLTIFSPFCKNQYLNIHYQYKAMKKAYFAMKKSFPTDFQYQFYENGKGLFPWAMTGFGDELYWNYTEGNIEIVVYPYSGGDDDSRVFHMTITEFLYKLATRKVDCDILPEDLLTQHPNIFTSYSDND